MCVFPFSLSRVDYLSQCNLESLPVCLSPEVGQCQQVCPKVLVKCKSSNIQHENVGEWFEFLRQIPFVNIANVNLFIYLELPRCFEASL